MKKYIFLIIAGVFSLALLFLLGTCRQDQDKSPMGEQPMDRRIGIIKSLGSSVAVNRGTHILELDDGETVLLRSIIINLDDEKYKDKVVEVKGVLDYTTDGKQIMTVSNIDILSEIEESEKDEPAWVTYGNTGLEFSLSYRNDLTVKDAGVEVSFIREFYPEEADADNESDEVIAVQIKHIFSVKRAPMDEKGLTGYLGLTDESAETLLAKGMFRSKVGEQGLDAIREVSESGGKTGYYIDGGAHIYIINIESGEDEKSLSDENIYFEMLNTFVVYGADTESHIDSPFMDGVSQDNVTTEEPLSPATASSSSVINFDSDLGDYDSPSAPAEAQRTVTETNVAIDNFSTFESESFKFAFDYPGGWFFEGKASGEAGVLRTYVLGDKPLDEKEGFASVDVISGTLPAGDVINVNGTPVVKVASGGEVAYYVDGAGSRVYKVSGEATQSDALMKIASTVRDL